MNDQYDQEWDAEQEQHWKAEEKQGKTKTQREWCINNKCKLKYTHISGWFPGCIDYMETQREWGTVTEREWDKKWYKRAFFAHDDDFDDEVQAVVEFMHQRDAAIRAETIKEVVGMIDGMKRKQIMATSQIDHWGMTETSMTRMHQNIEAIGWNDCLDHLKEQLEGK